MGLLSQLGITEPQTRSIDEIINNVRELAEEYPDTVYSYSNNSVKCSYVEGQAGPGEGCIIGQALIASFVEAGKINDSSLHIVSVIGKLGNEGLLKDVTSEKIRWLSNVQGCQDRGYTWEESVIEADKNYPINEDD